MTQITLSLEMYKALLECVYDEGFDNGAYSERRLWSTDDEDQERYEFLESIVNESLDIHSIPQLKG